jgi:hypothetical protein
MRTPLLLLIFVCSTFSYSQVDRNHFKSYGLKGLEEVNSTLSTGVFCENFDSYLNSSMPSGWSTSSLSSAGGFYMSDAATINTGSWDIDPHGKFMIANDDKCNCNSSEELLATPSIDLTGVNNVYLSFDYWNDNRFGGGEASVHMSINGSAWDTIVILSSQEKWAHEIIDINAAWNNNDVKFRFGWTDKGNWSTGFAIDNIKIDTLLDVDLKPINYGWLSSSNIEYSIFPLSQFNSQIFNPYITYLNAGKMIGPVQSTIELKSSSYAQQLHSTNSFPSLSTVNVPFQASILGNGVFDITYTNDQNNSIRKKFAEITNKEFALDLPGSRGSLGTGIGCKFETGNLFEISTSSFVEGVKVYLGNGTTVGSEIYAKLLDYNSGNFDSISQSNAITLTQNDINNGWVTVNFINPISVSNQTYVAAIGFASDTGLVYVDYSGKQLNTSYYRSFGDCGGNGTWNMIDRNPKVRLILKDDCVGLEVSIDSLVPPTCPNSGDGVVYLAYTGGQAPVTFNWSNASTNQNLNNVDNGIYNVSVTEGSGCTLTIENINLSIQDSTIITDVVNTNALCGYDGTLSVSAEGVGPMVYRWGVDRINYGPSLIEAGIGYHTVEVTDGNQCIWIDSFLVNGNIPISVLDSIIYPNCDSANGNIWVTPTGGSGIYTYLWSNSSTANNLGLVSSGMYSLTVNDGSCSRAFDFNLADSSSAYLSALGTNPTCFLDSDGEVNLTIDSGGTAPFSYLWSNSSVIEDPNNFNAGLHKVTVTDANNCSSFLSITLYDQAQLIFDTSKVEPLCIGDSNGSIQVNVNGGIGSYSYTWNPAQSNSNILQNIGAGTYDLTVTDANNCTRTTSVTLDDPNPLNVVLAIDSEQVGNIDLTISGGELPYTYAWNTGNIGEDLLEINQKGTYSFTVVDFNGCQVSDTIDLVGNVSVQELLASELMIYPNPSDGNFNYQFLSSKNLLRIQVLDARGSLVEVIDNPNKSGELYLEYLTKGVYFLSFELETSKKLIKVMIQ